MSFPREAIIIAGGLGQRMGNPDIPKWLTPIGETSIAAHQLKWLYNQGIERVILTLNKRFKEKLLWASLKVSWEDRPIGDEGGLKKALGYLEGEEAVVVNCDVLTDLPLRLLPAAPSLVVVHPRSPWGVLTVKVGCLEIEPRRTVCRFEEKPLLTGLWINAGIYRFLKSSASEMADEGEIARGIVPKMLAEGRLSVLPYEGKWTAVETLKDAEEVEKSW